MPRALASGSVLTALLLVGCASVPAPAQAVEPQLAVARSWLSALLADDPEGMQRAAAIPFRQGNFVGLGGGSDSAPCAPGATSPAELASLMKCIATDVTVSHVFGFRPDRNRWSVITRAQALKTFPWAHPSPDPHVTFIQVERNIGDHCWVLFQMRQGAKGPRVEAVDLACQMLM